LKEIYKKISDGWLYQHNITGDVMKYDYNYANHFNEYNTNEELSKIRYDFCKQYSNFDSILDVGYGNGAFLKYCRDQGINCWANDISGYPVPYGVKFTEDITVPVDLVTFFDCIEHFTNQDINKVLQTLNCKFICLSVPWCHYTEDIDKFEKWKHRKPNEHFHHFDIRGITKLLNISGFNLIICSSVEDRIRSNNGCEPNILTVIGIRHKD
jgi:hypothetical protein